MARSQDVAESIITEFKDRYPEFMRVLYRRNKEPIARRPPRWSEATLQKQEATKEKREARARKKALYEEYKLLPKGRRKKDFNIMHGRYGAGTRKRKPRYSREEVNLWKDQTKRDNYLAGLRQRKISKG